MVKLYHSYAKYVHRLVAKAFLENPNNYNYINHKDGNKLNNNVNNLEWCTSAHNNQHAYDTGLKQKGENFYNAKLTEKQIIEIRELINFMSQPQIAELYGVSRGCIEQIVTYKTWKHLN